MKINYPVILWDFDGVIMDSMPIRDRGFLEVLKSYPQHEVNELMVYHRMNGGLSRYAKFRYFFSSIRRQPVTEETISELSQQFSEVMLSLLINADLLIQDSLKFIVNASSVHQMHIVSGSDGKELNYICKQLGIDKYFISISGSPTPKTELVKNLLKQYSYNANHVVLIGDSKNDFDASAANGIAFIGYNNPSLLSVSNNYITSFSEYQPTAK